MVDDSIIFFLDEECKDEIQALVAMYPDELVDDMYTPEACNMEFQFEVQEIKYRLLCHFSKAYPSCDAPTYRFTIPGYTTDDKMKEIATKLSKEQDQSEELSGLLMTGLSELKEYAEEYIEDNYASLSDLLIPKEEPEEEKNTKMSKEEIRKETSRSEKEEEKDEEDKGPKLEIYTGPTVVDRKSTFQAHIVCVEKESQVSICLAELNKDKKIARATHNIYAYRIIDGNNEIIEEMEDDGEHGAGVSLMTLMKSLQVTNVLVVVSRWFGGVLLGNVRFKHISDAAKKALQERGLGVTTSQEGAKKSKKKR